MRVPATFATILALAVPAKADAKHVPGCRTQTCDTRIKVRYLHKLKVQAVRPYRAWLARVRWCESTNNYRAVDPTGTYRGAYQFDLATFRSVGGKGDPADASKLEQDFRAVVLLRRRGTDPWPQCG